MKLLLHFIKPYGWKMLLLGLTDFLGALASLFLPYCMNIIVDEGIPNADQTIILRYSGYMAILALVAVVCMVTSCYFAVHIGSSCVSDIRSGLFRKVNSLSFEEYGKIGTASLLTRQSQDTGNLFNLISNGTYFLINVPTYFIGGTVMALKTDQILSLVMLSAIPIILALVWIVGKKIAPLWEKVDKTFDELNALVRDRLSGIRVIRAFDRENYEHERTKKSTKIMSDTVVSASIFSGIINPLSLFFVNLVTVGILCLGAKRMEMTAIVSAGGIVACMQYVGLMAEGILNVSWLFVMLPQVLVSLKRIDEVFSLPSVELGENGSVEGDLRVEGMTFSYPDGSPVLKDITLSVKKGETVGVIGGTGAGKSSLLSVLMGFYDYEGNIFIGEKEYRSLSKSQIRDHYSIALQKSMIFEGTAKGNITMGNDEATEEEIKRASKDSEIAEFIESQEKGYEMELSAQGKNLSGGQKQRINLARTILKDAPVYLFDDSFSALDFLTESKVRKALNERLKDRSRLIVTQRVATAMHCDKIYVLDEGKIVGEGTHETLLTSCEVYAQIVRSQMGGVV